MGGRGAALCLAILLAGCLRDPSDAAVGPSSVGVHATGCALVWMEDASSVPLARAAAMLPANATPARSGSGHAIVALAGLACAASEPAGLSWAWVGVRASLDGRTSDHVVDHWTNESGWSAALAPHGAATPVESLVVEVGPRGASLDARDDGGRVRLAMPPTRGTGALPATLDLTLETGSTLALRLDAAPRGSSAAFELPAGSRARELLGATGARGASYAESAAVEGELTRR